MKTSVYVPDELWDRVLATTPDASASALLQECLKDRMATPAPAYAVLSDDLMEQRDAVYTALGSRLIEGYRQGYRLGLALAAKLESFELFAVLKQTGFHLGTFERQMDEPGWDFDVQAWWLGTVAECGLGAVLDSHYDVAIPVNVRAGITDALRGAWEVVSGERSADAAPR